MKYPIYLEGTTHGTVMNGNNIIHSDLRYPYEPLCWTCVQDKPGCYLAGFETSTSLMPTPVPHNPVIRFANALKFDGNPNFIAVPGDGSLDILGDKTISVWVSPDAIASYQRILINKIDDTNAYQIGTTRTGGFYVAFNVGGTQYRAFSNGGYTPGVWHHLVARCSSSGSVRLYVNGIRVNASSSTTFATGTKNGFLLGKRSDNASYFKGLMDDVAVWNRLLSITEITNLYNGSSSPLQLSPVAYWNCDSLVMNGSLQVLADQVGSAPYGNNPGYANYLACPQWDAIPRGASVYLAPDAVNNTLAGYSGGKVEDVPYTDPIMGDVILVDETTGSILEVYYEYNEAWGEGISYWKGSLYENNDPTKPYTFGELVNVNFLNPSCGVYDWAEWYYNGNLVPVSLIVPNTNPTKSITVDGPNGSFTFTVPAPMYYASWGSNSWVWDFWDNPYWGGTISVNPIIIVKPNFITGFEPMKGAGGIGSVISQGKSSEIKAWLQAFRGFLSTNPTKEQVNTWMTQNPKPSGRMSKSSEPNGGAGPRFRGAGYTGIKGKPKV